MYGVALQVSAAMSEMQHGECGSREAGAQIHIN
jgi:hypothetical protein